MGEQGVEAWPETLIEGGAVLGSKGDHAHRGGKILGNLPGETRTSVGKEEREEISSGRKVRILNY